MSNNSISQFRNDILSKYGIARANRYEVTISTPWDGDFFMPAEAVTLPGRSFVTMPEQWYGPETTIPIGNKYDGHVIMTFPVADDQVERQFFESWMDFIVNPKTNLSSYQQGIGATMKIATLDGMGQPTSTYDFEEVYPSHILPGNMGASMFNDYTRMQVQFEYRMYRVEINA